MKRSNYDEWPNLTSVDDITVKSKTLRGERPRFPDGDPIGPLTSSAPGRTPWILSVVIAMLLVGAVIYACSPTGPITTGVSK